MPLLNDADAIYLGATAVDAVYLGSEKVWPPQAPAHDLKYSGQWEVAAISAGAASAAYHPHQLVWGMSSNAGQMLFHPESLQGDKDADLTAVSLPVTFLIRDATRTNVLWGPGSVTSWGYISGRRFNVEGLVGLNPHAVNVGTVVTLDWE